MDNAQKAIMIGVGLFITIIIIAAVMAITGMGTSLLNSSTNKISALSSQLERELTDEFDGTVMTGARVRAAISRFYSDPDMLVGFTTTTATGLTAANFRWVTMRSTATLPTVSATPAGYTTTSALANNTQLAIGAYNDLIASTSNYNANLLRVNGVIRGVIFVLR